MIMGAVGFMFGTGGSAVVSQALGEGKPDRANKYFSMMVYVVIGSGIVLTLAGLLFLHPIAAAFGATGEMLDNCVVYGRIILCTLTAFMLQNVFQSFLVTAERPQLGLAVTVAAGVTNMVLDFVFIAVFHWGIVGAAAATAASQLIGGLIPDLHQRLLRADDQYLDVACQYPVQFSAHALHWREWCCRLWHYYVCQLYLCGDLYRLLHRKCADHRLSLRRWKPR